MEYRRFGQTDEMVSVLGFGCWEMGGGYGDISETEGSAAVQRAIDLGVNCFDTAPAYGEGQSERFLGKALGPLRKDVLLVTKWGIGYPSRRKGRDGRRETALASIEQSLLNLQTDYVDLLLVHWPDIATPFEETMGAMEEIVQQGKARYVGLSNFTLSQVKECMRTRRVDVVQYGYNLFDRRSEQGLFPYFREQDIGVMAYGPLASGLLAGAFTEDTKFGEDDWRGGRDRTPELDRRPAVDQRQLFLPGNFQRHMRVVSELKPIAERHGKKVAHLALRWVLSSPAVSVALVGTRKVQEVEENMEVLDWELPDADRSEIDAVFAKHGIDTSPNVWIEEE